MEDQDRKQLFSVQVWEVVRQKPPVRGGCEEEGKEVEEEEDKEEERGKGEEEEKEEGKEEEEDEKETPVRLSCDAIGRKSCCWDLDSLALLWWLRY